jgi:predicted nucleotide-binding protein (sugar kinase/HSP70/actin superfamily)
MTATRAPVEAAQTEQRFSLPLVQPQPLVRERVEQELARERERLLREAGVPLLNPAHFKRPVERPFTRSQRDKVTLLVGGLTMRHDELLLAGLRGLGYKVARLPVPTKTDFQAGKEYGNNGQCNPTYFTVGNLVNYLKDLRDKQGVPLENILNDYAFVTAGTCGPCRFGMYEAEYRLALRNSGFDGFRVMLFDQTGGADQAGEGGGLEFNVNLFLMMFNALFIGDLLNEVAYHVRPYEVVPGSANAAFAECMKLCQDALAGKDGSSLRGSWLMRKLSSALPLSGPNDLTLILDQLRGDYYPKVLRQCRDLLNERVEVDYLRPRPIVKVTGEFWAQTTEGEGNFRMFSFLEGEGAQVLVEPVATWISYILFSTAELYRETRGLADNEAPPTRWQLTRRARLAFKFNLNLKLMAIALAIVKREYERLRGALGGTAHKLVSQLELQRLGNPYYDSRSEGGEGHMEVAKNIYYANNHLAHMVLSLKPFGCMPSTQSDGAQAAVVSHFSDMIYLPIETSGEGDINAYSRVQMALGEAKVKCKNEFAEVVRRTGYSAEQIQAFVAANRELRRPLQTIPHHEGVVGQAANFALYVGERMKAAGVKA